MKKLAFCLRAAGPVLIDVRWLPGQAKAEGPDSAGRCPGWGDRRASR